MVQSASSPAIVGIYCGDSLITRHECRTALRGSAGTLPSPVGPDGDRALFCVPVHGLPVLSSEQDAQQISGERSDHHQRSGNRPRGRRDMNCQERVAKRCHFPVAPHWRLWVALRGALRPAAGKVSPRARPVSGSATAWAALWERPGSDDTGGCGNWRETADINGSRRQRG
jgi:hypothetical protein